MPTIDELAPATAVADSDEFVASQSGVVRKVTRAQITSGYQPMFALASGSVVGRSSPGTGPAEQISVGSNLTLNQGTLSANATPYVIAQLTNGMVPATFDLVPIGQYGENVAISYGQFMSGLSGLSGIDLSSMTVTPSGSATATPIGAFAANVLMRGGGTMTGPVTLAGDPSTALGAATKRYVDNSVAATLPLSGGTLTGSLTLNADPVSPLQAVTKQYVDAQAQSALQKTGATLLGPLTLAGNPTGPMEATTKQYVDGLGFSLEASQAKGDSLTDDTAAINAFLASLPAGARVVVPAGHFYLIKSGNLLIPTGITVEGAAPFANPAQSALFSGCGFLLNPAFSVVMNYASQIRNLKVLRAGLLSNPTASDVNQAVATWDSEALIVLASAGSATGSSVLNFTTTAGVAVGMPVSGKGVLPGTTVLSLTATTVTMSQAVAGTAVTAGQAIRFGASIGIVIPVNQGNNVLSDLQIIGFHTGILAMSGEFFASRVQADCITVLEATWAGDNAYLSEFHCVPYYGVALGNALNCWRRPGPAFYLHDQTDGWTLSNFFALHWETGFQLSNVGAVTLIRCGYEKIQDGWTGTTGFLWQGHAASCQCFNGYSNGAAIGMDMQHNGEVQISGMSTVGATDGTGLAHYRLGSGSYGAIYNAMINEAGPATPVVVQPNVIRWKIISPFVDNGSVSPWISIDPSSIGSVDLFNVRDTNGFSAAAVETHLHEKIWLSSDPSISTSDGSPQATLTVEATAGGNAPLRSIAFIRSGADCGSIQTVPPGASAGNGLVISSDAAGSDVMLVPSGGALVAAVPDGGIGGGTARGAAAVDLQMSRTTATEVASGAGAVIVGGSGNTGAADHCVAGGNSNTVRSSAGVAFGFGNLISGSASAAPGGANGSDRGRVGTLVWSSDMSVSSGLRQASVQILGAVTTDGTLTRLTADSQSAGSANTVNMPTWSLYAVRLVVAARHFQNPDAATWLLDGLLLHCGGSSTAVTLVGGGTSIAPTHFIGTGGSWTIAVAADSTNSGLSVSGAGAAGATIHWTASVETTEAG